MYKSSVAAALAVSLLAGCTTMDPYTGEQKTSQAAKGTGIGALGGAILGAAVAGKGNRNEGALAGALLGGAVGGGIGYYQDQQEMALRQELEGTGVRVQRVGDDIRLIMPGNITFGTDSDRVDPGFYPVLDSVATVLNKYDKTVIDVEGYTDSTGSDSYNQQLSERRAEAVGRYLMSTGVDRLRISVRGYGERNAIADNATEAGRALNRRVEVRIRGTQQ